MHAAMATGTVAGPAARSGWGATRLVTAGLVVLLILGAMLEAAGAAPSPGSYQNAFTAACRNHGGTPKRVRTRVVKCTLADGTVITCDFNFNPPSCTKTLTGLPSSPVTDPFAPPTEGNEQPMGGGIQAGGGAAVDPGGTIEQVKDPGATGGGVIRSAARGGEHDHAQDHGRHQRQRHGKGRKG